MKIIQYIAEDNPINARNIFNKIKSAALNLVSSPKQGRMMPELKILMMEQFRELIVSRWRIIYRFSDSDGKVHVLSVLDSRQNVEDILLNRLIRSNNSSGQFE